jgi:hypothetical protein
VGTGEYQASQVTRNTRGAWDDECCANRFLFFARWCINGAMLRERFCRFALCSMRYAVFQQLERRDWHDHI